MGLFDFFTSKKNNSEKDEPAPKPQPEEEPFIKEVCPEEEIFNKEIYSETKEKLKKLKTLDKRLAVFGADAHLYNLKAPIDLETILQFEKENEIKLPQDYKEFITYLGNGGAGRSYRMMSLKDTIWFKRDLKTPFKGVDNLLQTYAEIQWNQDREKLISLHGHNLKIILGDSLENQSTIKLFNTAIEANLDFTNQYFNFAEPQNNYIIDPIANLHSVYLETNRNEEFTGYLSLFSEGCGHEWGLIVNGEDYGKIVMFGTDGQLGATNQSFTEFYNAWLNENLEQFEKVANALNTDNVNMLFEKDFWSDKQWKLEKILCSILDIDKPNMVWGTDDYKKYILSLVEI